MRKRVENLEKKLAATQGELIKANKGHAEAEKEKEQMCKDVSAAFVVGTDWVTSCHSLVEHSTSDILIPSSPA